MNEKQMQVLRLAALAQDDVLLSVAQDDNHLRRCEEIRRGRRRRGCLGKATASCGGLIMEIGFESVGPDAPQFFKRSVDERFAIDVDLQLCAAGDADASGKKLVFGGELF